MISSTLRRPCCNRNASPSPCYNLEPLFLREFTGTDARDWRPVSDPICHVWMWATTSSLFRLVCSPRGRRDGRHCYSLLLIATLDSSWNLCPIFSFCTLTRPFVGKMILNRPWSLYYEQSICDVNNENYLFNQPLFPRFNIKKWIKFLLVLKKY